MHASRGGMGDSSFIEQVGMAWDWCIVTHCEIGASEHSREEMRLHSCS